jgi:tRNA G10  N-methylase Trm11
LTEPGDWVFDPTCGTGTTLVEAYNHGRNSAGVELEFPKIARANIDYQTVRTDVSANLMQGDARETSKNLDSLGIKKGQLRLVINGTPYPKISNKSSDAPERKKLIKKVEGEEEAPEMVDNTFDYQNPNNIGLTKGTEYWGLVNSMYSQSIEYLKPGGYFVILIKDMIQNKKPYLLSSMIANEVLENNPDVEYHGLYIHRHIPETMFMRTYPKMYPGVPVPSYQAGIVLKKK